MIKVGFYGTKCYDTIQYIAAVLNSAEKKVAMLDFSVYGGLRNSLNIPAEMNEERVLDSNGADYYMDEGELNESEYDVVFAYYGLNDKPDVEDVQVSVLVTDYDRTNMCHVEKLYKEVKGKCDKEYFLHRDMASGLKLTAYIKEAFPGYEKEFRVESRESGDDIKAMLNCAYENVPVFKNINGAHMNLVESISKYLIFGEKSEDEIDEKEFRKLFRTVAKGKKYRMKVKEEEPDKKKGGKRSEGWFLGKRK